MRFRITGCRLLGWAVGVLSLAWMGLTWGQTVDSAAPLAARTAEGFAVPQPGTRLEFPRDHGSHPAFKVEWWYVTGHLWAGKRRFGFQATFFRFADRPAQGPADAPEAAPRLHTLHLAHMALLDVQTGKHYHQERLNREGWDASAAPDRLDLRNGNWRLWADPGEVADPPLRLQGGVRADLAFDLALTPTKGHVIFGRDGVSRKGAAVTAASYYITFPRLQATGTLRLGAEELAVTGQAWMDHEISSSQLGEGQVGWDWASIQLTDGRELMVYVMRHADGRADPFSTLAWVNRDGEVTQQGPDRFSLKGSRIWTSPRTGARYPLDLELRCRDPETGQDRLLRLLPLADAQEMHGVLGNVSYWEGACRVLDAEGREIGSAYVELTGYAASMQGRF